MRQGPKQAKAGTFVPAGCSPFRAGGNRGDRAVRVVQDRVDDRPGAVVYRTPTQYDQVSAGGQAGQGPAGVPVHHVLAHRDAGILLPPFVQQPL